MFNKFVSIKVWHRPGAHVQSSPLWLPGMLCSLYYDVPPVTMNATIIKGIDNITYLNFTLALIFAAFIQAYLALFFSRNLLDFVTLILVLINYLLQGASFEQLSFESKQKPC